MGFGKNLKVVIFDFDGTLFHLNADWQTLARVLGIDKTKGTMGEALQRYKDEDNAERLHAATLVELDAVGDRRIDTAVAQQLVQLSHTHRIAIFTRNSHDTVDHALEGTVLEGIPYIIGREDTHNLKPDPEGLEIICKHFSISADQAILVGDTDHDVIVAHALGMPAIVVVNPTLPRLPEGADGYAKSITDIVTRIK